MGKYARKGKLSGEVAVMEFSHHQAAHGVRTRARTLAASAATGDASLTYLELRSRRLAKPPPPSLDACRENAKPRAESGCQTMDSVSDGSAPTRSRSSKEDGAAEARAVTVDAAPDLEFSLGDNLHGTETEERRHLVESRVISVCHRHERETTPCSLIRNSEMISTPTSTSRRTNSSACKQRRHTITGSIPTTSDVEEFFANVEQLQQQYFQEKYNFDFVNGNPVPGRYEWQKPDF